MGSITKSEKMDKNNKQNRDLTISLIDRQNILNNPFALKEIENATQLEGIEFEGKKVLIKEQVAKFFEVDTRTIENYLSKNFKEITKNGYEVIKGNRLKSLKNSISTQYVPEKDFRNINKIPQLGIFDFRAFLNLSMLMAENERAKLLRKAILDIVIDTINKKTGGSTKYINQRDEDFIISYFQEEDYRKEFTDALKNYVDMGKFKYPLYTDKIYRSIFKENAKEYRKIINLKSRDNVRDTFYSEILDLISSYEYGFSKVIENAYLKNKRKLSQQEVDNLFKKFEQQPHWLPLINKARQKMASRDFAFREALHDQLTNYIVPIDKHEFERFLGEKSKELIERLEDAKDIMKRLKERK